MTPRYLLFVLPLFMAAACAGETASDNTNAPAQTSDSAAAPTGSSMGDSMSGPSEQASSAEIPEWETDGPVDEAAASARDIVLMDLDVLRKAGEGLLLTNPDLSDEAIRDEVVASSTVGSKVMVDGATGVRVTASEGEISCSGLLAFQSGTGTWSSIECS